MGHEVGNKVLDTIERNSKIEEKVNDMIKDEDKDENLKEVNNIVIFVIYILTRDIDNVGRNNEIWYEVHDFVIENNGDLHQDYVILPKVN